MVTRYIYMLRGLPASGKSTWAKEWANMDPQNRLIISKDDIREMFGKYWVPEREDLVTETFFNLLFYLGTHSKCDIALDTTGLNPAFVTRVRRYVNDINEQLRKASEDERYQYQFEILKFSTNVDECIARDKKRSRQVGEKVIRDFYTSYRYVLEDYYSKS